MKGQNKYIINQSIINYKYVIICTMSKNFFHPIWRSDLDPNNQNKKFPSLYSLFTSSLNIFFVNAFLRIVIPSKRM